MTKKKLDDWPSKSQKPIDDRPQAKPTNPAKHPQVKPTKLAKQWHQQNPQIQPNNGINKTHKHHQPTNPSAKPIHKPRTSNHRPQASTNSQTFQTHKIFITSLLCGFVIIRHWPPHNKPKTNNPNQNPQKKLKLHMLNWVSNESNVTTMDILENLILYSWLTLELVYLFHKYIDLRVTMIRLEHIEPWYLK